MVKDENVRFLAVFGGKPAHPEELSGVISTYSSKSEGIASVGPVRGTRRGHDRLWPNRLWPAL